MHEYLLRHAYLLRSDHIRKEEELSSDSRQISELTLGHVIKVAVDEGLRIEAVVFREYTCLDIGTPDDLVKAVSHHMVR
jgi:glucose-1-phosphate thymidylyltransferase